MSALGVFILLLAVFAGQVGLTIALLRQATQLSLVAQRYHELAAATEAAIDALDDALAAACAEDEEDSQT